MNKVNKLRYQVIVSILQEVFSPSILEVIDESSKHENHMPQPSQETHFKVRIQALALEGISLLEAHRKVNNALSPLFREGLHALSIEVLPMVKEAIAFREEGF